MRHAVAALSLSVTLMLLSCGSADPCDGRSSTCLALTVTGSLGTVDSVHLDLAGPLKHSFTKQLPSEALSLPVTIAILLPDVSGTLVVHGAGLRGGATVGLGHLSLPISFGHHMSATLMMGPGSASCSDQTLDGGETDVDCGGECPPCTVGAMCRSPSDCAGRSCSAGVCQSPQCSNGVRDGNESDVDCGGSVCAQCPVGKSCNQASDCTSRQCTMGRCSTVSCSNSIQDADETDVDCGGTVCPACAVGRRCQQGRDCLSMSCAASVCTAATCGDQVRNGSETDVDCGGSCLGCANGKMCIVHADCASGVCAPMTHTCAAPSCSDGIKNNDETDIDCGGSCLKRCGDGAGCLAGADCVSGACNGGHCAAAHCTDGVLSGNETDVDCGGGECVPCGPGKVCGVDRDCLTGCLNGRCRPYPAPGVTSVSPRSIPTTGAAVTISGIGFQVAGTTLVRVNTSMATNVKVLSTTQITAVMPPGSVGSTSFTVVNPDGQASSQTQLTYFAATAFQSAGSLDDDVRRLELVDFSRGNGKRSLLASPGFSGTGTVAVYDPQPDGSLRKGWSVAGYSNASAGDLNNDGQTDIVVASGAMLCVVLGSTQGLGSPTGCTGTGGSATGLVVGDVSGDNLPEVVITRQSTPAVLAYFFDATTRSLMDGQPLNLLVDQPWQPLLADLDGINGNDLIVTSQQRAMRSDVVVALHDVRSKGVSFLAPSAVDAGSGSNQLVIADLNQDGELDLVSAEPLDGTLSVMLALPGTPGHFDRAVKLPASGAASAVAVADVDGDRIPDLVSAGTIGWSVLHGNGDGTFSPSTSATMPATQVAFLLATDLDLDGRIDLVLADAASRSVLLLRNTTP